MEKNEIIQAIEILNKTLHAVQFVHTEEERVLQKLVIIRLTELVNLL